MLIKLRYTSAQPLTTAFRLYGYIINNTSITSIGGLVSQLSADGAWSGFTSTLDTTNSYIVRTITASNCLAHVSRPSASSGNYAYNLIIRQKIHDAGATDYVYYRWVDSSTTANSDPYYVGSAVSGSMTSTQWAITSDNTQTTSQGSVLTLSGTVTTSGPAGSTSNFYTAWFYITDYSVVWGFNMDTDSGLGISTSSYGNGSSGWSGLKFISQYKRFDYWNTNSNSIYPVAFNNTLRATGPGTFQLSADYSNIQNPVATNSAEAMLMVLNMVTTVEPSTSATSWTTSSSVRVAWGLGTRFSDVLAMISSATSVSTQATGPNTGQILWVDAANINTRMPIPNLQNRGYPLLPLTWRNMRYNAMGGNISEIGDFYLFNGDYFPGDEFTYNGRTFVLFPTGQSWTTRLAIALPKE